MKPVHCLAVVYKDGSIFIDSTARSEIELTSMAKPGGRVVKVKVVEHKIRSLPANNLLHLWHQSLSGVMGYDVIETKQVIKIMFGFPVLLQEENEISKKLNWMLERFDWIGLSWIRKIKLAEMIPCTSLMTTKQLKLMMDNIKDWAISEHNISLDNGKRD
jgi:hypothetical protein